MSAPCCLGRRPTWATAILSPPTGTCRKPRNCWYLPKAPELLELAAARLQFRSPVTEFAAEPSRVSVNTAGPGLLSPSPRLDPACQPDLQKGPQNAEPGASRGLSKRPLLGILYTKIIYPGSDQLTALSVKSGQKESPNQSQIERYDYLMKSASY
jgi:hypothetical protein